MRNLYKFGVLHTVCDINLRQIKYFKTHYFKLCLSIWKSC